MKRLPLTDAFLQAVNLLAPELAPLLETEYRYCKPRLYRADYAIPSVRLLVELEGGVWRASGKGAHAGGTAIERDCERSRLASMHGYRVYRLTRKALEEQPMQVMEQLREAVKCGQNINDPAIQRDLGG